MSRFAIGAAAVAAVLASLPAAAQATPSGTSCPGGASDFVLWDVTAEPYGVDNLVDESGNADGWACAKPIYVVTDDEGNPFQIYNFLDNKFQPQG
ncbi:hypothetical protein [Nocardioides bigeumensis]|jgi:hypothetical protein|uniref:Secreted protein n=1 Tax=Nocardioides bigeumensis TaxID=433657 RepID=A0ABP5KLV5_9ACTN